MLRKLRRCFGIEEPEALLWDLDPEAARKDESAGAECCSPGAGAPPIPRIFSRPMPPGTTTLLPSSDHDHDVPPEAAPAAPPTKNLLTAPPASNRSLATACAYCMRPLQDVFSEVALGRAPEPIVTSLHCSCAFHKGCFEQYWTAFAKPQTALRGPPSFDGDPALLLSSPELILSCHIHDVLLQVKDAGDPSHDDRGSDPPRGRMIISPDEQIPRTIFDLKVFEKTDPQRGSGLDTIVEGKELERGTTSYVSSSYHLAKSPAATQLRDDHDDSVLDDYHVLRDHSKPKTVRDLNALVAEVSTSSPAQQESDLPCVSCFLPGGGDDNPMLALVCCGCVIHYPCLAEYWKSICTARYYTESIFRLFLIYIVPSIVLSHQTTKNENHTVDDSRHDPAIVVEDNF